jgi:UDP-N-acetylmuramate--alanine ligase
MMDELVDTFGQLCRESDSLFLLPVYYAGGTAVQEVDSRSLADALTARNVSVTVVEDHDSCANHIATVVQSGDAVLSMGARDPDLPAFARSLVKRLGE